MKWRKLYIAVLHGRVGWGGTPYLCVCTWSHRVKLQEIPYFCRSGMFFTVTSSRMFPTLTITSFRPLRLVLLRHILPSSPVSLRPVLIFCSSLLPHFPCSYLDWGLRPKFVRAFMNYFINVKSHPPRCNPITPSNVICKYFATPNVNFSSPITSPCSVFPPKRQQVQNPFKTKAKM